MVSSRLGRRLKDSTLILMFLFVEYYPVIVLYRPSLYKRWKQNLEIKVCPVFFSYVGEGTDWALANGSLNPDLFYPE